VISTEDVVAITQNVFETMLQTQIDQTCESYPQNDSSGVVGCIHIAGEWSGAVLVRASNELAKFAASRMLMVCQEEVVVEDLQDTLAELTNMIGGNIKSIVPSPSNLSLPTVTNGNDFKVRTFGASPVSTTNFSAHEGKLQVVVLESEKQS
jgi:chemotaxis protein CheX